MSTPNIFKNKLRNILLSNYINTTNKNTLNNDSTISKALINTHRRIHKDNNILPITGISPFRNLTSKNFDTIKPKKNYDKNKLTKNRNKMKILNEINKLNKKKEELKTIETINFSHNKKIKNFRRNNTFQKLNKENATSLLNKPPRFLGNVLFTLDKEFIKEISPINNFINVNKKVNEYKKRNTEKTDNFYCNQNMKTINNKVFKYDIFNKNKNKYKYITKSNKSIIQRRNPSFLKFNTFNL
jgi:hypothetical protein